MPARYHTIDQGDPYLAAFHGIQIVDRHAGHGAAGVAEHFLQFRVHTDDFAALHKGDADRRSIKDGALFCKGLAELHFGGLDAGHVRRRTGGANEISFRVVESQSIDAEVNHPARAVHVFPLHVYAAARFFKQLEFRINGHR